MALIAETGLWACLNQVKKPVMKQSTKAIAALILSLAMILFFFTAGIPEASAFFTIISVLLIEVVRYEVRAPKPANR
jgi:hypothetical protein